MKTKRIAVLPMMAAALALSACGGGDGGANTAAPAATPEAATVHSAPLTEAIKAAAADPARGDMADTDARRHGPEILAFAGVAPGQKILDLIPGSAYWTKLLARTVGPQGHVYGYWPEPYARESKGDVRGYAELAKMPDWSNLSLGVGPADALMAAEPLDLVFTSQNYHDYNDAFMGKIGTDALNRAAFVALKPGGIFLVIDHAAAPGSGMRDTDTLHRIDPETLKQQVVAAGFVYDGALDLLANPADDHAKPVFDKAIRGHTDQFILRFRKPAG